MVVIYYLFTGEPCVCVSVCFAHAPGHVRSCPNMVAASITEPHLALAPAACLPIPIQSHSSPASAYGNVNKSYILSILHAINFAACKPTRSAINCHIMRCRFAGYWLLEQCQIARSRAEKWQLLLHNTKTSSPAGFA